MELICPHWIGKKAVVNHHKEVPLHLLKYNTDLSVGDPEIGDLEAQGEEFECAQFIDQLDEVEFWVRNPVRRPGHSFWLQTST